MEEKWRNWKTTNGLRFENVPRKPLTLIRKITFSALRCSLTFTTLNLPAMCFHKAHAVKEQEINF